MKPNEFQQERETLNKLTLEKADLITKRFFNLDTAAYSDGALPSKTKEMLGLVASMVLRCDDCIRYHLDQCYHIGVTDAEIQEVFSIALIVGGSIVIPHLRRANELSTIS
jgi:ribonuclease HI